ncbi:unnamed protein product [Arctia plantaginis]|uniref:Uncharacterized protein n=1 Tax=Arctia plantaginis TaxID=874455 RepID=A0A8S1A3C0_ARCPL|nr:unnamed protein product [Arctia plantaginis]
MLNKSGSDTNNPPKSENVNVSCWNCVMFQNDEDYGTEVSLSQIRKQNRQRFKLYSALASEISRPKAMPITQKVKENYVTAKIMEKKLMNHTKNTVSENKKVSNEDPIPVKPSNIEIPGIKPTDFTDLVTKEEEKDNDSIIINTSLIETSTPKTDKKTRDDSFSSSHYTKEEQSSTFENKENVTDAQKTALFEIDSKALISESTNSINSRHSDVRKKTSCQDLVDNELASNDQDFKTSLPALNITQKRNILKSTKSLSVVNETNVRPSKCLRWSTLDMPRGQNSTTNCSKLFSF